MNGLTRALSAEFIGTFALIFLGAGAGAALGGGQMTGIALAHGLTIMVFASAFGDVSGGHINPAVTIGLAAAGVSVVALPQGGCGGATAIIAVDGEIAALTTTGTPLSPRTESAAVYDPVRDRMVIACGRLDGFTWYSDIRGLLLSGTPLWHAVGTNIQPVSGQSAVYDGTHDRMVMFGGVTGGSPNNEVVSVPLGVPSQLAELAPSGPPQPGRFYHSAIYDPRRDQMVLFGGDDGQLYADTWEWDGSAWHLLSAGGGADASDSRNATRAACSSAER